jgi:hypothetical protein
MKLLKLDEADKLALAAFHKYLMDQDSLQIPEEVAKRVGRSATIEGDYWSFDILLYHADPLPTEEIYIGSGEKPRIIGSILVNRKTGDTEVHMKEKLPM